jgi:gliding motility-associated-like protein
MLLTAVFVITNNHSVSGQVCDSITPSFIVDLRGSPDSTWTSPSITREGSCCGATHPDVCIEFVLTLDSMSSGINFQIPAGALPGGALFYQFSCGTSSQVGEDICLSGPGPHRITFCKPGNNPNVYQIKAIPKPNLQGKKLVTQACSGFLKAEGLVDTSITWTSVPFNTTYNSFLSCQADCDSVSIVPSGTYPPAITYRVCGKILGGCGDSIFCDTATVRFVTNIEVSILPKNPTICFGDTSVTITATPVGGLPPFRYTWNTLDTSPSIQVNVGTYKVTMLDSVGCATATDSVTVTAFESGISAFAGNDTAICTRAAVVALRGSVVAATGGRWTGGSGSFVPSDTSLNASYSPSATEISAGFVDLILVTTGNGTCPPDSDTLHADIIPTPVPVILGPDSGCVRKTYTYRTGVSGGDSVRWTVTRGTILGSVNDSIIVVRWDSSGAANIHLVKVNASGCDSAMSLSIVISPTPEPVVTGPDSVCENRSALYSVNSETGLTYHWTISGGTVAGSLDDTLIRVFWPANGTGEVSVTVSNSLGCDSAATKLVFIAPTPAPQITGPDSACEHRVTLHRSTGTAGSYQWSATGGVITGSTADSIILVQWDSAGIGSVSLRVVNAQGCDSVVSVTVIILPTPVPEIDGPVSVCEWKQEKYRSNCVMCKQEWIVTGGSIASYQGDSAITVVWGVQGNGTVQVRQTNQWGCDSVASLGIVIQPTPVPVISGPDSSCEHKTAVYRAFNVVSELLVWNVAGGMITFNQGDTLIGVLWDSAGAGIISLTATNSFGCDSTAEKDVLINPTPIPAFAGPDSVCEKKSSLYTTARLEGITYQWTVSGGTINGSVTDTFIVVSWGPSGNGTVSLQVVSASGCDSILQHQIVIRPTPLPTISGDTLLCANRTGTYFVRKAGTDTYNWSVSGGAIQSVNGDTLITVKWQIAGYGSVELLQANNAGCDSATSLSVHVLPPPTPQIYGPASVCAYHESEYYLHANQGNTYNWLVTGGSIESINDTTIRVRWAGSGNGTVTVTETTALGCDSLVTLPVVIEPSPVPVISGPARVCAYKASVYTVAPASGDVIEWTVDEGDIEGSPSASSITVIWGGPGTGTVTLKLTNIYGCDSTVSLPVTLLASPVPAIKGKGTVCAGVAVQHYEDTSGTTGNYSWVTPGGTILAGQGTSAIDVEWPVPGNHLVVVSVTDPVTLCDSTVTFPVYVDSVVKPAFTINSFAGCIPLSVAFSGIQQYPGYRYIWSFGNGYFSNITNPSYVYTTPGSFTIRLVVENQNKCRDTVYASVEAKPKPLARFDIVHANEKIYAMEDTVLFLNRSTGGNKFKWEIGLEPDSIENPSRLYVSPGVYKVKLTVIDTVTKCESTLDKDLKVWVREAMYIPNAFTPNGDGINDFFFASKLNVIEFEIIIFNRWGQVMFQSNDPAFRWDGNYDGAPAQCDDYGFGVTGIGYNGTRFSFSGTVTLLR